jgi:hypothetical protein
MIENALEWTSASLYIAVKISIKTAYIPDIVCQFSISLSVLVLTPCRFLLTEYCISALTSLLAHTLRSFP